MSSDNYFSNKKVWITGASAGIGHNLAVLLSKAGAQLIISARRAEELEKVKAQCANPNMVDVVIIDLASKESVKQAYQTVKEKHGAIDILFNNGGISQRSLAMETDAEVERKIMEVDFFSNVLLSKLVAGDMIAGNGGHLVITSTLLGKWGFYLRSSYAAAKHALHGYYDSMRMEVEPQGVFITLVTPGFIATEISKNAFDAAGTPTGNMDDNQAGGMPVEVCAQKILEGVAARKKEFAVGGKEILGLWVKRFFPKQFDKILRKKSAT
jgi:dehydrogenase/reductase SDR family member 7B